MKTLNFFGNCKILWRLWTLNKCHEKERLFPFQRYRGEEVWGDDLGRAWPWPWVIESFTGSFMCCIMCLQRGWGVHGGMQITLSMVVGREAGLNGQCETSHRVSSQLSWYMSRFQLLPQGYCRSFFSSQHIIVCDGRWLREFLINMTSICIPNILIISSAFILCF